MTGRYTRKSVPFQETHSIPKSKLNTHPLPEENEEDKCHTTNRSDENDSSSSWEGLVSNVTDACLSFGNSTDRSFCSNSSWAEEDEFDRQATCQVRKMFDNIERALFEDEEKLLTNQLVKEECQEWKSKYPHLRIVGSQLLPPQDLGYQLVPRESTSCHHLSVVDLTTSSSSTSSQDQGLTVTGKHINSTSLTKCNSVSDTDQVLSDNLASLEEEIFEEEGQYEEFLAFDNSLLDKEHLDGYNKKLGVPPVTPLANIKDNIMSAIFDLLWTEMIGGMSNILKLYCDHVLKESQNKVNYCQQPPVLSRSIENSLAKLPLPLSFQQPSNNSQKQKALDGVLTISSKTLLNRSDRSALLDTRDFRLTHRPTSGPLYKFSFQPLSIRADLLTSNSRQTSARKATPRGRLLPLEAPKSAMLFEDDCLNTHEILRGTRLPMTRECVLSPSLPAAGWSRSIHTPLPPIDTIEILAKSEQSHHHRDTEDKNHHKITSLSLDPRSNLPQSAKANSLVSSHRASIGFNTSQGFHSPFALRGQHILTHSGKTPRSAKSLSAKTTNTKISHYHRQVP